MLITHNATVSHKTTLKSNSGGRLYRIILYRVSFIVIVAAVVVVCQTQPLTAFVFYQVPPKMVYFICIAID